MNTSSDRHLREFLEFAHDLAEASGTLIRDAFTQPHSVGVKDDASVIRLRFIKHHTIPRAVLTNSFG